MIKITRQRKINNKKKDKSGRRRWGKDKRHRFMKTQIRRQRCHRQRPKESVPSLPPPPPPPWIFTLWCEYCPHVRPLFFCPEITTASLRSPRWLQRATLTVWCSKDGSSMQFSLSSRLLSFVCDSSRLRQSWQHFHKSELISRYDVEDVNRGGMVTRVFPNSISFWSRTPAVNL